MRSLKKGFQVPVGLVAQADRHVGLTAGLSDERVESCGAGSWVRNEVELLRRLFGDLIEPKGMLRLQSADPVGFFVQATFL